MIVILTLMASGGLLAAFLYVVDASGSRKLRRQRDVLYGMADKLYNGSVASDNLINEEQFGVFIEVSRDLDANS